MTKSQLCNWR